MTCMGLNLYNEIYFIGLSPVLVALNFFISSKVGLDNTILPASKYCIFIIEVISRVNLFKSSKLFFFLGRYNLMLLKFILLLK